MTAAAGIAAGPPMSPRQLASIREATGRVNIYDGAIRSGKTIASLLRFLIFIASAPRTGELVIVGRTRDSAWRNVIGPLQDRTLFGAVAGLVVGNYGAPFATILGRRVYVFGANDAKAETTIRGLTVAGAYVDEVTVLPEQFFTQLLGRMSVPGAQLFGTTNPDNPAHWLLAKFLGRLADLTDWRRFRFTIDDNPHLSQAYVESIKREFTGLWYRRFILGEWVAAEGAVFPMWDPAKVVRWDDLPDMQRMLAVGIDWGTTNATSAVALGMGVDDTLYLVDEWRHDPKRTSVTLTVEQQASALRDWMAGPHLPAGPDRMPEPRIEWVAVDPSAAALKIQLHQDGVAGMTNADNDVSYGIQTVASGLGAGWLRVADRCRGFISEAPGYSWDPKATEKGEDKPIKVADHSLDAGRYALATSEPLWRRTIDQRQHQQERAAA